MHHRTKSFWILFMVAVFMAACSALLSQNKPQSTQTQRNPSRIANPASQHCIEHGGTLSIQKRGDGGEYGICVFDEGRPCEEWAMLRGDCPVGGIKTAGYSTPAAQYCAITGGEYAITGNSNMENEQGTCSFKDGRTCDVWDYFNGTCSP